MEINKLKLISEHRISVILLSVVVLCILSACTPSLSEKEQDAAFNLSTPPHKHFQQFNGNEFHPAEYFTCGGMGNPCKHYHNINQHFSGEK